ncbi:serine/threonine-protein kinase [Streptomyces sp. NPDC059629]|uniref:serine/threonine-protein kinase n=1 Tax=Streptomyces sp. NPDC059629 TaxID=3346889 RepID=UPI00367DD54B
MGEVFAGRYELADPIGHGGVGAVWRAWDHRRKRYVAAKVLQQSDAHALLRFVREQALRIDHPHVLAPASWAADDDKVLFTMDLVAGGSLVHLVGDYGPLPPAFVCTLLDQLLSGLAAVHAEGVVHRDIKPANILLEASGTARPRLRLSDFGIAMRFGEARLTETNLVVGTPGYIAPEQLLGADPDFAADLYAVGLVALYLLEGAKPDARALVQYFAEHGTPGAPKGVPEPLWQVVATLVQPDPRSRFRTATGARKALAQARELLPEPDIDDETIEIFDQLGPLPPGFEPEGPVRVASGVDTARVTPGDSGTTATAGTGAPAAAAARQAGVQAAGAADAQAGVPGAGGQAVAPGTAAGAAGGPGMPGGPAAAAETGSGPAVATGPKAGSGMAAGAGSGTATGAGRASASSPVRPGHADAPPSTGADRAGSSSAPVSMSDTGSFRLPPPQTPTPGTPYVEHPGPTPPYPPYAQQQPQPLPHPQQATPTPQSQTPWPPAQPLPPVQEARPDADTTTTATYTARDPRTPQAPQAAQAAQSQLSAVRTRGRRRRRARRAGPPAKAAVPILLLALACYAVGFWALTRI